MYLCVYSLACFVQSEVLEIEASVVDSIKSFACSFKEDIF